LAEDAPERIIDKLRRAEHSPTYVETSFSKDSRGGENYSIRERGRYGSSPLHDDHDS
jgi:hypothetical protein